MKRKGFTLIELLAVIIILGILMLIAIPSVTTYINNSRKNTYVDTIQEIIKGAVVRVNNGDLDMFDTNTTYYIPTSAIQLESGKMQSPYGNIENDSYVVVTYDGESYDYYYVGKDATNVGVGEITKKDNLTMNSIQTDIGEIDTTIGIEGKDHVVVFTKDLEKGTPQLASRKVSGNGASINNSTNLLGKICKRASILHSSICYADDYFGCTYYKDDGDTIVFGNDPSTRVQGRLAFGDAFDCDVNGDGTFDSETERFYYLFSEEESGNHVATLIYYSNVKGGLPSNNDGYVAYDNNNESWQGPRTAIGELPSTTQWSNPKIILPKPKQLLNEQNTTKLINQQNTSQTHTLPVLSYGNKAARILSYQDMSKFCSFGEFIPCDNREFMVENSCYDGNGEFGYWLETPYSYSDFSTSIPPRPENLAWAVVGSAFNGPYVRTDPCNATEMFSVRPIISVLESDIEY